MSGEHGGLQLAGVFRRYRHGSVVAHGDIPREVDSHHWLELACRPSMETFVCDLSSDDGGPAAEVLTSQAQTEGTATRGQRWRQRSGDCDALCTPTTVAYSPAIGLYPLCRLLPFFTAAQLEANDLP